MTPQQARAELAKREMARRQGSQPAQPQAPPTRQEIVRQKMQEMENQPLSSFASGAGSVMTMGLSDLLGKKFGINPPQNTARTAGQVSTALAGILPLLARSAAPIVKGIPYTRVFKGGEKFAARLAKSPATVDLTQEAETLARARHGVNPALDRATLSKAEQFYQNATQKTPIEDLLNARGQVPVSTAHEVGNLANQNLAKSVFEMWGEAMRGGNKLRQLGLKAGINQKIQAADPALKEVFQNYGMGQNINKATSVATGGALLEYIRRLIEKSVR